jgi:1-acyl-sn-glycerol-3-phosphate acyltransferase
VTAELDRTAGVAPAPARPWADPWRRALAPWTVAVFFPAVIAATAFFGVAAILLSIFSPGAAFYTGVGWARLLCAVAFVRVRVRGRERTRPGVSYVAVANHQGDFDILALYGFLGLPFRWVIKQELRDVPVLGWACERIGHVFIDRANPAAAIASLEAAKPRLAGGVSALFFPEGTRTLDGRVGPFKKGAFRLARQLDLPILPVSVSGSRQVLPKGTLFPRPGTIEIVLHPPIPVDPARPLEEEIEAARAAVASAVEAAG